MEYKHFSHPHNLNHLKLPQGQQQLCHGCRSPCQDSVYACWNCNFFLHEHCGNASRYVNHPSHPQHPLILIPSPTYCSGSFICNACGRTGSSVAYCCALCELDLHVNCAFMPRRIAHKGHQHELVVNFSDENRGSDESGRSCGICREALGNKNWFYFCPQPECDFRVHTGCGTTEVKPGLYQGGAEPSSESETEKNENKTQETAAPVVDPVAELLELQLQMQMTEQLAQMMASFNLSQFV